MMRKKQQEMFDSETARLAVAKVRVALARLADACNHACHVLAEANSLLEAGPLLERSAQTAPEVLSLARGTAESAAEVIRLAADIPAIPHWDPEQRVLSIGMSVVSQYRAAAPNQEAVLAAFQEDGWPRRIDDPLCFRAGLKPKYRLHFTIQSLNESQRQRLIRFYGDGTGEGICWELRDSVSHSQARPAKKLPIKRRAA
jgi:hypothetical protein